MRRSAQYNRSGDDPCMASAAESTGKPAAEPTGEPAMKPSVEPVDDPGGMPVPDPPGNPAPETTEVDAGHGTGGSREPAVEPVPDLSGEPARDPAVTGGGSSPGGTGDPKPPGQPVPAEPSEPSDPPGSSGPIAGPHATDLPWDGGPDTLHPEIDTEIINHLLFHQALGDGALQIDKYIEILRGITDGEHIIMADPRDRTTALVFELVLQEDFNPWDIDLKRFATSYVRRLTGNLDFITAGRLISMAYRILKLQSSDLLFSLSEPVEDDFEDMGLEEWMEEDESYLYTRRVVEMPDPPIEETITHRGNRRVTLFELVEAFGEAATESEKMREHNLRMQTERNRIAHLRRRNRARAGGQVHDEDYQEDIRLIDILLGGFGRKRVLFSEILPHSPIDPITTFISLLFLNFDERIFIEQKDFPRGDITITIGEGEGSVTVQNALDSPLRMASEA